MHPAAAGAHRTARSSPLTWCRGGRRPARAPGGSGRSVRRLGRADDRATTAAGDGLERRGTGALDGRVVFGSRRVAQTSRVIAAASGMRPTTSARCPISPWRRPRGRVARPATCTTASHTIGPCSRISSAIGPSQRMTRRGGTARARSLCLVATASACVRSSTARMAPGDGSAASQGGPSATAAGAARGRHTARRRRGTSHVPAVAGARHGPASTTRRPASAAHARHPAGRDARPDRPRPGDDDISGRGPAGGRGPGRPGARPVGCGEDAPPRRGAAPDGEREAAGRGGIRSWSSACAIAGPGARRPLRQETARLRRPRAGLRPDA